MHVAVGGVPVPQNRSMFFKREMPKTALYSIVGLYLTKPHLVCRRDAHMYDLAILA